MIEVLVIIDLFRVYYVFFENNLREMYDFFCYILFFFLGIDCVCGSILYFIFGFLKCGVVFFDFLCL